MLRMKYFKEFENNYPFLVILGDKEALYAAYKFFAEQKSGYLNDTSIVEFAEVTPLKQTNLFLNEKECREIAQHFRNLSEAAHPCHAYFDTAALGNEIEIMISYREYEKLF